MNRRLHACVMLGAALAACGRAADAAPPASVADFTRRVQPLLLNRCATGACHGGPESPAPRLLRGDAAGRIDREITLANMDAILAACGPARDPATMITTISERHPASAASTHELAAPLSPRERATLENWLRSTLTAQTFAAPATATPAAPNRLQKLLDTAANPPALPPPQGPQGVILK